MHEMGVGVSLYFVLVRALATMFFFTTLLALPGLYLSLTGSRSGSQGFSTARLSVAEAAPQVSKDRSTTVFLLSWIFFYFTLPPFAFYLFHNTR